MEHDFGHMLFILSFSNRNKTLALTVAKTFRFLLLGPHTFTSLRPAFQSSIPSKLVLSNFPALTLLSPFVWLIHSPNDWVA